ncbi:sporulation integral membrane protein YtvI [Gorillibacterium sp. sgz5001074]|uniref:sporulation integral membrane protein YtvI n=1 Tax=Gorillibacterium sp. sgz5001074 TaxID=3446695 RepID=UPI003F6726C3
MISFYKRYYKTVFDIALILVTIYLFMLLFSYLYRIATPIFLAFVIFAAIEPLAKVLNRRGMKKSAATAISMLLFIIVILAVLIGLGVIFVSQISSIMNQIPYYTSKLQDQIALNANYYQDKWDNLPPDLADRIKEYGTKAAQYASQFTQWVLGMMLGWLTSFTAFIANFLAGIILAYFLSVEIDTWKRLSKEHTPSTFKTAFLFLKDNVLLGIGTYLKAQMKLVSITGVTVFAGLLIFGVKNAFSVSLLSALFDVLPLLGISTFFLPWIVYLLIVGQTVLAIKISILTAIVLLVRQILEPKITGDSLGVSAFTMLSFMIISLSLFGVAGLILSPVLIITIKALHEQGYLKRWIRLPEDEYKPEIIE